MNNELENHMTDREDLPTTSELTAALNLIFEKQNKIYNVLPQIEIMIGDANRLNLDKDRLDAIFNYLSAELDDCETERKVLLEEIGEL